MRVYNYIRQSIKCFKNVISRNLISKFCNILTQLLIFNLLDHNIICEKCSKNIWCRRVTVL